VDTGDGTTKITITTAIMITTATTIRTMTAITIAIGIACTTIRMLAYLAQ